LRTAVGGSCVALNPQKAAVIELASADSRSLAPHGKCRLGLDNIRSGRPDLPCKPRKRQRIARNLSRTGQCVCVLSRRRLRGPDLGCERARSGRAERKGRAGVGAVTNSAIAGRGRALQRAAAAQADRAERDTRIDAAAAQVSRAMDAIRAAAERRALAVAAAERAIANAERDERDATTAATERIVTAVRQLRAEGLTIAKIAELLGLPMQRVRGLIKHAHTTDGDAAPSPPTAQPGGGDG
jgi:hypothetical protein